LIQNKPGGAGSINHSLIRSAIKPLQELSNERTDGFHKLQPP
jgi:hypothetical protein